MLNEQVRNIMTTNPAVVSPTQSIAEVSQIMVEKGLQQLPVAKEGQLLGMITSHDLWKNEQNGAVDYNQKVEDVMTTNVIKITPIDKVGTAAELFMDKRFKSLPVVNLRNELKGVVTAFDLIKHVVKKEYPTPILYKEVLAD